MSNPPFKVKAVFEYSSPHDDDLHFPIGQIITVVEEEDEDWYVGEYIDASGDKQEGLFPRNFVEKYEPTAPPRPTRTNRPKKEAEVVPDPAPIPVQVAETGHEPEPGPVEKDEAPISRDLPPSAPKAEVLSPSVASKPVEPTPAPAAAPKAVPTPKTSAPPPVSEKPTGGSFRDRIAAFNKAAPPPAPFKPGGLGAGGSSNFVKKAFVAPPPSKNYYVPPPREQAPIQKIYRREEDPEIAATELENQEQAEKAGLVQQSGEGDEEDQPKPTSLKERIALLQKQQMEQAARHAEAAHKKEKPKRPVKKRTESHEATEEGDGAPLERQNTEDTIGKNSIDSVREEASGPRRRKSSKGAPGIPGLHSRKSFGDGNEADMSGAGDTTEEHEEISTGRDDSDEKPRSRAPPPPVRAPSNRAPPGAPSQEPDVGEEEGSTEEGDPENAEKEDEEEQEEEEEEEEEVDPEVRRKEELRARMAKMSGGMGMHGMFGPPGGMPMPGSSLPPRKKLSTGTSEKRPKEHSAEDVDTRAPPVPMIPMPGMTRVRSPEEYNRQLGHDDTTHATDTRPADEMSDVEDAVTSNERGAPPPPPVPTHDTSAPPPIPGGRPAPPPVPKESRPAAPSSPVIASPGAGSESDDEMSERPHIPPLSTSLGEAPKPPPRQEAHTSPKSSAPERASFINSDPTSPTSPNSAAPNKRNSRLPPPIPGAIAPIHTQTRAPPPPPPEPSVSRASTGDKRVLPSTKPTRDQESDEEVTEYEGDYDTDIASAAPHKDALKAHARDSSFDDSASARSPVISPTSAPPPLPPVSAPRAMPPPLPSQPPPIVRQSSDMPRAAPPPPPPSNMLGPAEDDDEYDPYRYSAPRQNAPSFGGPTPRLEKEEEDLYSASPPREHFSPPAQDRAAPPPPPRDAPPASSGRAPPRKSMEAHRSAAVRRSTDLGRMSLDSGVVAHDVDLSPGSFWWTQPNGAPAVFQNRKDILYESEESTTSKRGGKSTVTKDLYVLFQDYSQTIITAQFDPQDPKDVKLEQRHELPPSRLRQDQLEAAHEQFGKGIYEAVCAKKDTVVGDGTPQGLIQELLKPFSNALLPVGTRSYGAVVYANLANASTTQNDEIRPGDIITLRNTKFQGKHGPMHAKYSVEVGKPDHVGVVAEWDGTKKKVRAWEQGRESKKTKMDSFKLDDLRSGEVKIWRVMPRSWVGWQGEN